MGIKGTFFYDDEAGWYALTMPELAEERRRPERITMWEGVEGERGPGPAVIQHVATDPGLRKRRLLRGLGYKSEDNERYVRHRWG